MKHFECVWLSGKVACEVSAPDELEAGQQSVQAIAARFQMARPPVLASSLAFRFVGLFEPVADEDSGILGRLIAVVRPA